ncbi:MAG: glucose 1-dehydrogenase [Pseudomonas sp.]|uniref:glucose 1-dehydrogenase n=1 Tax=Pseudomonas TaxID=286 RepID=UPI001C83A662|nr:MULTISPECIES: glucose 1-dehydrogenase [Pseudomonas]MDI1330324.1 glucose 1-dehydrogenase [Pseudomonas sp.]MDO8777520.1 glucose 1-dehydrogenase [Burkholderiaceae bacterium]MDO9328331.1 glucose 1-dehydrogenase [Pseudomonas sp.]QZB00236.1 glucose 1-dehydrogenase [Pseudomonas mandelii]
MSNKLAGKVALVTGGSTGIGLASAQEFAAQGATVFITGRRQAELDAAVALIGDKAVGIKGDVANLTDLDHVFSLIAAQAGHLDIVFANAGVGDMAPLGEITEEHFEHIFGINVKGLLFTVQKALPLLRNGGSVILNASTTATKGTENFSVYSASKAAVRNFARSWLLDLKPRNIRVNAISPGPVATPGVAGMVPAEQLDGLYAHLASLVPMGRMGDPGEVAKAVLFLASDDSSFINGIELFVDGGAAQI